MDNLIWFVYGEVGEAGLRFTPETLLRYMSFVLVLSCISAIVDAMFRANR